MDEFTYEYLPWRSVNGRTMELFNVRTKIDSSSEPVSIGFPYSGNSLKIRTLKEKNFYWHGEHKPGLFGRNLWAAGSHKFVTITEGELDALSYYQVLGSPVCSVQSAGSALADCTVDIEWLRSFDTIVLAFDGDAAGREACARVAKLFDYAKTRVVKFDGVLKDANAYLEAGKLEELKAMWWNAKHFMPDTIVSSFSDFEKILKENKVVGVPYPFKTLNEKTFGIRLGESVLITAQEGVGKTELMHNIEYQLLTETEDNVGAIYLEEPQRRHLLSLAALRAGRPVYAFDAECSEAEARDTLKSVLSKDDRLHLYSNFGSADPKVLTDTIRFLVVARSCRFILLDHVSMVVSGSTEADERRAIDRLMTELETMVTELNFALIVVSHVNDDGLTRGSRYISKVIDIRIDITRDILSADPVKQRTTHLFVSKNRFCGRTGPAGSLLYDPETGRLEEIYGVSRLQSFDPQVANDNYSLIRKGKGLAA